MNSLSVARSICLSAASLTAAFAMGLALVLAAGCSSLLPKPPPQPAFYSLDGAAATRPALARAALPTEMEMERVAPTLIVNPPRASAGFDSQRIIYTRESHRLEYFAHSEWADTPARMLAPLLVAALDDKLAFRAVVMAASVAAGDLRLDTEIVRLQQNFDAQPSRVRFTLRAVMVDNATRRVLAWREFDETVAATRDDPQGGVVAANRAVQTVLHQVASFCVEAAGSWRPASTLTP